MTNEIAYTNHDLDQWIRDAAQGDRDALDNLYRATAPAVYAYALSILRNQHSAEDVLHDCFVTVLTGKSYQKQGKPMSWLMTVTRNLCLKQLNRQSRTTALQEDFFGMTDPSPEDRAVIQSCLKELDGEDQQIVILHVLAEMTFRQIGQHMDMKPATVLTRYHRAIKRLRTLF